MPISRAVVAYLATAVVLLAIDAVWLAAIAPGLYRAGIGHLMAESVDFTAALAFYVVYCLGIVVFAVAPAITAAGGWREAAWRGGFFGFCCYATYDLTNQATLRDWPVWITLMDLAWGTALTATTAIAATLVTRRLTG